MSTKNLNEISAKEIVPRLISSIVGLSVVVILLVVANIALAVFVFTKKVESFAVTESGRVVPLVALDKPYVNDQRVSGFTEECLRSSFAHDYENWRATMSSAKNCYTGEGAKAFESAMAPMLDDVRSKRFVMSSSLEPTVVARSYLLGGAVHWEVETPLTLYRRGTREQLSPIKFMVTSIVKRVALDENVRGISLHSINLKPISGS